MVAYRVIGVEYDATGKLTHMCFLHKPHRYDSLPRDTKMHAPSFVEAETKPSDTSAAAMEKA